MDSLINREIDGRYRVTDLIGEGAHAAVYRAHDAVRHSDVALKVYEENELDAQIAEAARQFEVHDGSCILPLLDVHPHLAEGEITVMPLMESTLARPGRFFASEALHQCRRVLTALEFCHGRGVIHGDVKPSNIFLNDRGECLLGDFGVADFLPGDKRGHTLEYAAPELLHGHPRNEATDVWAAAVLLYELLTGRLPFGNRAELEDGEVGARIASTIYKPPEHIKPYLPLSVRHFFGRVFVAEPDARSYMAAGAMRGALPEMSIRAEWEGHRGSWNGVEVTGGRKTGVRYRATVVERPRLGVWEAEVTRATAGSAQFRRWNGVPAYRGSEAQAFQRMAQWMRNITQRGAP